MMAVTGRREESGVRSEAGNRFPRLTPYASRSISLHAAITFRSQLSAVRLEL
jgi:hypothetical protein